MLKYRLDMFFIGLVVYNLTVTVFAFLFIIFYYRFLPNFSYLLLVFTPLLSVLISILLYSLLKNILKAYFSSDQN